MYLSTNFRDYLLIQGEIVKTKPPWFGRTIIRSCAKLDYAIAQRCIDGVINKDMVAGTPNEDTSSITEEMWPSDRRPSSKKDRIMAVETNQIIDFAVCFCARSGFHSMESVHSDILALHNIAKRRREARFAHGAVTLNKVKLAIERDSEGFPIVCLLTLCSLHRFKFLRF